MYDWELTLKILIFVDDFAGGAGKNAQVLSISLRTRGYEVSIVLVRPSSQPRFDLHDIKYQTLTARWQQLEWAKIFSSRSNG